MKMSLNAFLKYYLLPIIAYVSCENFPLRAIRFDADISYTCYEAKRLRHNLPLDGAITKRLNTICAFQDSHEFAQYYLIATNNESPNEGTAVDVPFESPQVRVTYYHNNTFKFQVSNMAYGTWNIVCVFPLTPLSIAQELFNSFYSEYLRPVLAQPFIIQEIRKNPNFASADCPYANETFVYREGDQDETATFLFTLNDESLTNPILIVSNGDFQVTRVDLVANTVLLLVTGDEHPYILIFEDSIKALVFARKFWDFALAE